MRNNFLIYLRTEVEETVVGVVVDALMEHGRLKAEHLLAVPPPASPQIPPSEKTKH